MRNLIKVTFALRFFSNEAIFSFSWLCLLQRTSGNKVQTQWEIGPYFFHIMILYFLKLKKKKSLFLSSFDLRLKKHNSEFFELLQACYFSEWNRKSSIIHSGWDNPLISLDFLTQMAIWKKYLYLDKKLDYTCYKLK